MHTLPRLIVFIIATLGVLLVLIPYLPATIAGNFVYISLGGVPITLIVGITTLVLIFRRKCKWRWIWIFIFMGDLRAIQGHFLLYNYSIEHEDSQSIQLLSWNVSNFHIHEDTLQKAADFIRQFNPDIICLQERPHENLLSWETIQRAFSNYPYTARNEVREDEVLNLAILSKYPLSEVTETYFEDSYNKIMDTHITLPTCTFKLYNTHLQTTGHNLTHFISNARQRNIQADSLSEQIQGSTLPIIVCGDFNDTPCSYVYRTLTNKLKDAFREASEEWTGSFQPMGRWLRIDYILCSKHWQVQHYQLMENPWSDHKMQLATLSINNEKEKKNLIPY